MHRQPQMNLSLHPLTSAGSAAVSSAFFFFFFFFGVSVSASSPVINIHYVHLHLTSVWKTSELSVLLYGCLPSAGASRFTFLALASMGFSSSSPSSTSSIFLFFEVVGSVESPDGSYTFTSLAGSKKKRLKSRAVTT